MLVTGLYLTWLWDIKRSLNVRLLAVLHISLAWFSVGMALYVIQSVWLLTVGEMILGKAPLHALAIGFLTSMVLSMGTRVSLGHSGRELYMDRFSWACFLGVQLSALLRIVAGIDAANAISPVNINLLAALAWLIFIFPWAIRYGSYYLTSRLDGQEG